MCWDNLKQKYSSFIMQFDVDFVCTLITFIWLGQKVMKICFEPIGMEMRDAPFNQLTIGKGIIFFAKTSSKWCSLHFTSQCLNALTTIFGKKKRTRSLSMQLFITNIFFTKKSSSTFNLSVSSLKWAYLFTSGLISYTWWICFTEFVLKIKL